MNDKSRICHAVWYGAVSLLLTVMTSFVLPAYSQGRLINVSFKNTEASEALIQVERKSGVKIQFRYSDVDFRVTYTAKKEYAAKIVKGIIGSHGLSVDDRGSYILVARKRQNAKAADGDNTVRGRVEDEYGNPLVGAYVTDKNTKRNTVTDTDGNFSLKIQEGSRANIEVTYLGMKNATWRGKTSDFALVRLIDDNNTLDDVVVTGYQQLDRRNLTSSVVSKDMSELDIAGVSDLSKMLEGKIPDLIALNNSGEVNATTKIRIRGTSTLIGNREPLWVLDGIILTDPVNLTADVLNDPDYVNRIGNAIAGINPQDIQRIDVLKDAAATALYGTRAANGVIVITTKTGREGKPIVSYSAQLTVRKRPYYSDNNINLMSSAERMELSQYLAEKHYAYPQTMSRVGYEEALRQLYAGLITRDEFNASIEEMSKQNTDWFDLLCRNSFSQNHSVNISGGSENVRYYTSVGYTGQNDVIKSSNNTRYTVMAKINYNISRTLRAEVSVNGNKYDRHYPASNVNPINYAYNTNRIIPAYNADGSYYKYLRYNSMNSLYGYYGYNILNELASSNTKQKTHSVIATASLRWQPLEELFFNGVFSANISDARIEEWHGEESFYISCLRGAEATETPGNNSYLPYGGELSMTHNQTEGWTARLQGNYNKYLDADKHNNINIAAGVEASSSHYTGDAYTQRGYFVDRGKTFATNIPATYSNYWSWVRSHVPSITDTRSNLFSVYATVSYSFKDFFTLNANGRYDGSNKFGNRSNEKILPIWSVSGNANIKRIFKIKAPWLNALTLKSSYGEQGNMLDGQTPKLIIRKGGMDAFYNEFTSTAANFANPDLKWEKTHSFNVGLETAMLKNRLQIEVEYYHKRTTDAFMDKTISDINGFESYVVNSGTVTNSGFNFTLTGTPVRLKDFYWIVSGNFSKVYNKVHTAPGTESYELNDFLNGTAIVKNQPVGTFYSYRFAGLNPVDGGPLFEDWEERQAEMATKDKYTFYTTILEASGKCEPDVTGSLNNTFTYKQWRLGATLIYNFGAKTRLFRLFDGVSGARQFSSETNANRDLKKRWMKPGDEATTNIPAIICGGDKAYEQYSNNWTTNVGYSGPTLSGNAWTMYDYSNVRVVGAGYVKLSTLSLTYEFSKSQLDRIGLGRLALTLSGYNLHTWCDSALRGQTPTQGGFSEVQLSDTPSFTFGLTANF